MTKRNQSTKTAAQQAELDRLRDEKAKQATVVVENPTREPSLEEQLRQFVDGFSISSALLGHEVSWKRAAVAFFAVSVLAYGAGSLIGTIASYAIAGIVAFGGSMALGWLVWGMAALLSIYAGFKIGQHVGNYVLSGQIDRDLVKLKNKVTGLFKREEKEIIIAATA